MQTKNLFLYITRTPLVNKAAAYTGERRAVSQYERETLGHKVNLMKLAFDCYSEKWFIKMTGTVSEQTH